MSTQTEIKRLQQELNSLKLSVARKATVKEVNAIGSSSDKLTEEIENLKKENVDLRDRVDTLEGQVTP